MLGDLGKYFLPVFDPYFYCTMLSRLLSQQRRIMEGERGRHNGLQLNVLCMDCSLQNHRNSSMIRTVIGSCLKLLNRPRGELKLPGTVQGSWYYVNNWISMYLDLCSFYLVSRLRELHTLKGHVESVVKLKGLDIETIQQHYTVWGTKAFLAKRGGTEKWQLGIRILCLSFVLFLYDFVGHKGLE